jgi:hypothetical protein
VVQFFAVGGFGVDNNKILLEYSTKNDYFEVYFFDFKVSRTDV